jgi:hypothetical protein
MASFLFNVAPTPPDPKKLAETQFDFSQRAARERARLNRINQLGPFGTLTYSGRGTAESPFAQSVALDPSDQRNLDAERGLTANLFGLTQDQTRRVDSALRSPLPDGSLDGRRRVEEALFSRLNPQIDRDRERLRSQLLSAGHVEGSQPYNQALDELNRATNDARMRILLAGGQEHSRLFGLDAARRQIPLQELHALRAATPGVNRAQFLGVPQVGLSDADVVNPTLLAHRSEMEAFRDEQANQRLMYNQDRADERAQLGALYGLGGSALAAGLEKGGILDKWLNSATESVKKIFFDTAGEEASKGASQVEAVAKGLVAAGAPDLGDFFVNNDLGSLPGALQGVSNDSIPGGFIPDFPDSDIPMPDDVMRELFDFNKLPLQEVSGGAGMPPVPVGSLAKALQGGSAGSAAASSGLSAGMGGPGFEIGMGGAPASTAAGQGIGMGGALAAALPAAIYGIRALGKSAKRADRQKMWSSVGQQIRLAPKDASGAALVQLGKNTYRLNPEAVQPFGFGTFMTADGGVISIGNSPGEVKHYRSYEEARKQFRPTQEEETVRKIRDQIPGVTAEQVKKAMGTKSTDRRSQHIRSILSGEEDFGDAGD